MNATRQQRAALIVSTVFGIAGCSDGSTAKDPPTPQTVTVAAVPVGTVAADPRDASNGELIPIKVYKDPNCGCCKEWVKHLEANGFKVETMDMPDMSMVKQKYGVKPEMEACHTATVGNYVVEGHVPADLIKQMLKEKPAIAGLGVPGMPQGSPGMEGATKERYNVLTFDRAGRTTVYAQR
ncbi:MAG TPA: DUF411 domain-containing protein [Gemmatimonadaceae bacterium]|nr:DUF411 domain-containing protein [Gemmatimonadaceae bacterium]